MITRSIITLKNIIKNPIIKLNNTQKDLIKTRIASLQKSLTKSKQDLKTLKEITNKSGIKLDLGLRKVIGTVLGVSFRYDTLLLKDLKKAQIQKIKQAPVKKLKAIKIKIPSLPTSSTKRQGYLVKIKKGNQILFYTETLLPRKRATNLARKFTDKSIGASHSLTKKGQTNIIDVTKRLFGKKFRKKKSKNPKVQKEVEKRKFRIDSPKEKAQLAEAKLKKKSKAKLKNKIKKTIKKTTKNKKSPQTKPKSTKSKKKTSKKK